MGIDEIASRAVFLDRDGVLNRNVFNPESGSFESPLAPEDVSVPVGIAGALLQLQNAKYRLIVVSNQPNYAKGKASLATLEAIHCKVMEALEPSGIVFTATHYCLHHPDGVTPGYSGPCDCRKPSPYFLLADAREYGIDLKHSWMVGDRAADVACGLAAGTRTIRVREDHPATRGADEPHAEFEAEDLAAAAAIILAAG